MSATSADGSISTGVQFVSTRLGRYRYLARVVRLAGHCATGCARRTVCDPPRLAAVPHSGPTMGEEPRPRAGLGSRPGGRRLRHSASLPGHHLAGQERAESRPRLQHAQHRPDDAAPWPAEGMCVLVTPAVDRDGEIRQVSQARSLAQPHGSSRSSAVRGSRAGQADVPAASTTGSPKTVPRGHASRWPGRLAGRATVWVLHGQRCSKLAGLGGAAARC